MKSPLFIGVDGGASKCRAVLVDADAQILGTGSSGPANPFQSFDQSLRSIVAATQEALDAAGLARERSHELYACLGLAGVNLPAIHARMTKWAHPFRDVLITTDLRVACIGAHGGQDGAVIIAGTGSCGYACVKERETFLGGYGFPPGDWGSGAWMGLEAVRHVLLALDGMSEATKLTELISAELKARIGTSLIEQLGDHSAARYARLAPLVLSAADEGDHVACDIVKSGASYIAELARRLWSMQPPRMSLIGGLAKPLSPWLSDEVVATLSPPLEQPEMGSVRLAMLHWK